MTHKNINENISKEVENIKKNQKKIFWILKNTITEMKISLEKLKNRDEQTEDIFKVHKDKTNEMIESEEQKKRYYRKVNRV